MQRRAWLPISLALNAVLAALLVWRLASGPPERQAPVAGSTEPTPPSSASAPSASPSPAPPAAPQPPTPPPNASSAAPLRASVLGAAISFSAPIRAALQQLRAAGATEESVGAAAVAELDRQVRPLRQEQYARYARGELAPAEWFKVRRELDATRESTMRALLGEEAFRDWDRETTLRGLPASEVPLDPAERDAFYRVHKTRGTRARDIQEAYALGQIDRQEQRVRSARLREESDRTLREALGNERFARTQQDTDAEFLRLRRSLTDFHLAEEPLAAMFGARQRRAERLDAAYRRYTAGELSWKDYTVESRRIRENGDREVERAVGAPAFAELRRLEDPRYRDLRQFAGAWQLSTEEVEKVYTLVKQDGARSEDELRRLLGDDRFEKLKRAHVIRSR